MAKWYAATGLNGGSEQALDEVPNPGDYTDLVTGDKCFVQVNSLFTRVYEYDEALADSEDFFGTIQISAGNVSGTGAWKEKRMTGVISFWAGTIANHFDALVTEDGGTVSLDFEGTGSIPGLGIWSDDLVTIPIQSVELSAGSDIAPTANYIYILTSDRVTLVASTEWPTEQHIKVAYCLIPSAAHVAAEGAYINHNWNDGNHVNGQGHLSAMGENIRLTADGAHWHSGCAGNGATDDYITIVTDDTPDSAYFVTAAGICYQMHKHIVGAFNSQANHMHIVNAYGEAYKDINDIRDEEVDSENGSLTNKYYNIVFWQVANKGGEYSPVMMNMPSGSYTGLPNAINDVDGFDNYSLPRQFKEDSSTGFLICRITFRQTSSAITVHNTTDLRGKTPGTASGTSLVAGTEFADNQFKVYSVGDDTKIVDLDLSGLTSPSTRTITPADADMKILSATDHDDLTDGGDTTLHDHDGISENSGARHAESHDIASHSDTTATGSELETLTGGGDTTLHDHDGISENSAARHTQGTDTALGAMAEDIDMNDDYQLVDLAAPAALGEAIRQTANVTEVNLNTLTGGGDTTLHDHDGISENSAARHAESHDITSHSDVVDATGAQLEELTGAGDTTLHDHDGISENSAARHAESHDIASHSDTTATGSELEDLTDGGESSLHYHASLKTGDTEVLVSDGDPTGIITFDVDSEETLHLTVAEGVWSKQSSHLDNVNAAFGTGDDMVIRYDTTLVAGIINAGGNFKLMHDTDVALTSTPDGAVNLFYDNVQKAGTVSTGFALVPNAHLTLVGTGLVQVGTANEGTFGNDDTDTILDTVNTDPLKLRNKTDDEEMIVATPNGSVDLYFNGVNVFSTIGNGVSIKHDYCLIGQSGTSYIQNTAGATILGSLNFGGTVAMWGLNIAEAGQDILIGDPDGSVDLYYAGVKKLQTTSAGVIIGDGSALGMSIFSSNDDIYFDNRDPDGEIVIRAKNSADTAYSTLFQGDPDGGVELYYAGSKVIQTLASGMAFNTTALKIVHGAGSPEGVYAASPGSLFLNETGGANVSIYVKESGTGTTGWVAK